MCLTPCVPFSPADVLRFLSRAPYRASFLWHICNTFWSFWTTVELKIFRQALCDPSLDTSCLDTAYLGSCSLPGLRPQEKSTEPLFSQTLPTFGSCVLYTYPWAWSWSSTHKVFSELLAFCSSCCLPNSPYSEPIPNPGDLFLIRELESKEQNFFCADLDDLFLRDTSISQASKFLIIPKTTQDTSAALLCAPGFKTKKQVTSSPCCTFKHHPEAMKTKGNPAYTGF